MKVNDELIVNVEKLANTGNGIARVDGFVIFIEGGCPKDILKIKVTKVNKNFAQGEILEILTPSPHRVTPFCPMQKICGACQLQFIDYNHQLEIKRQITQDAIHSIGNLEIEVKNVIPSPITKNYRHKIQYPVTQTKNSKRILAGYYKPKTHEIVNIKYCPIQPSICDEIIEFIKSEAFKFKIEGYSEKTHKGDLRHIVIRNSSSNGKNLVTLVINREKTFEALNNFAKSIYEKFKEIDGVCVNFNTKKSNVILADRTQCIIGKDYIEEKILDKTFRIGAKTFFQVNPKSAENIFKYVKDYISKNYTNPTVLDAYAGISTFGICVSDVCQKVVSVEENQESCDLAKLVAKDNNIENIEINNQDAGEFFSNEKRKFDITILDPPRKGCSEKSLEEVLRLTKDRIIYVSCNPATLARDLKYLTQKGCKIELIQPVDMFCHTYHIENIVIIKK